MVEAVRKWARRTPVQTFVLCPLAVIGFQLVLLRGTLTVVPWRALVLLWGYLQYRLTGNFRLPRAGGSSGMTTPPDRLIESGPYGYTRNPMYLGHLIFVLGLAATFWSWFALVILAVRAVWFQKRVLRDEERLGRLFGGQYAAYRARVKRWIPGLL
ncbi:MAG TPA: isoprenylcysteine carboxylmethyltransferase family protein [Candidatus Elarobacter sp.]|nr:isoprenylcysteine carboxylmethyltransferase family protein [Candidatus Elarobacter sp.]